MTDNVPTDLARLKAALLATGWTATGATYSHPDAPGLRLNTAYAHHEATLTVGVRPLNAPRTPWHVAAYYRGSDPIGFVLEHVISIAPKIFESLADNLPSAP